jgi:hypothetical protein
MRRLVLFIAFETATHMTRHVVLVHGVDVIRWGFSLVCVSSLLVLDNFRQHALLGDISEFAPTDFRAV